MWIFQGGRGDTVCSVLLPSRDVSWHLQIKASSYFVFGSYLIPSLLPCHFFSCWVCCGRSCDSYPVCVWFAEGFSPPLQTLTLNSVCSDSGLTKEDHSISSDGGRLHTEYTSPCPSRRGATHVCPSRHGATHVHCPISLRLGLGPFSCTVFSPALHRQECMAGGRQCPV